MGNVLKFPNSLWQANYTIQQRGGRLPSTSLALQKHQQAVFQSIEFGLAGHQDIERNNMTHTHKKTKGVLEIVNVNRK